MVRSILYSAGIMFVFCLNSTFASPDEFFGPFASWMNVKEFGAKGDGKTDDTKSLQAAFDTLRNENRTKSVLYFPAGTYRISETLHILRKAHRENFCVGIYGEHPEKTVIVWDGAKGGSMVDYQPWYTTMGRITFDGKGMAKTALNFGPPFVTIETLSDLIIKDVEFGIEAGVDAGIAETSVWRCKFYRCSKAAISIQNFNSLDWWIWNSLFEDCAIGVTNEFGAGNFHVYYSVFKRSTKADLTIRHTQYFSFLGNYSEGSKAFLLAQRALNWKPTETWSAQMTIQDNMIVDPIDTACIRIENNGNCLFLDNTIISKTGITEGPVIVQGSPGITDMVAIGNQFTVKNPIKGEERQILADNTTVVRSKISIKPLTIPPTPLMSKRPVIEVPQGADADAIQKLIDKAVATKAQRPIIHFDNSGHDINKTIIIPANVSVTLVGDAIREPGHLEWKGEGNGPTLLCKGPSHVRIDQLCIGGKIGMVIDNCDQAGSMITSVDGGAMGSDYALVADSLRNAIIQCMDLEYNGIRVIGSPNTKSRVSIFQGLSNRVNNPELPALYSVENGGKLFVRDVWYEGSPQQLLLCKTAGEFSLVSCLYSSQTPKSFTIDNFNGKVTIAQLSNHYGQGITATGNSDNLKLMVLGTTAGSDTNQPYLKSVQVDSMHIGFIHNNYLLKNGTGTKEIANFGLVDAAFVKEMLATLRFIKPMPLQPDKQGITNVYLRKTRLTGRNALVLLPGKWKE